MATEESNPNSTELKTRIAVLEERIEGMKLALEISHMEYERRLAEMNRFREEHEMDTRSFPSRREWEMGHESIVKHVDDVDKTLGDRIEDQGNVLSSRISDGDKSLSDRVSDMERKVYTGTGVAIAAGALFAVVARLVWK